MKAKRFVLRKKLIGKGEIIDVTFKDGKTVKYDHDKVLELNKEKFKNMACWAKYSTYTSSKNIPSWAKEAIVK